MWCLRRIGHPLPQLLLMWWVGGWVPMILSQQHWDRETTILRGIVAWPAVFLISAIGLATLVGRLLRLWRRSRHGPAEGSPAAGGIWLALPIVLLLANGAQTTHAYFSRFGATQPQADRARVIDLVTYLEERGPGVVILPNALFTDAMTRFLLQTGFPDMASLSSDDLCRRLQPATVESRDIVIAVPSGTTSHTAFSMLETRPNRTGIAYLLPRLTKGQGRAVG